MQILGASLVETAETFLHAGYVSAYPRTFERFARHYLDFTGEEGTPPLQLDIAEALRLSGEQLPAASAEIAQPVVPPAAAAGDPLGAAVVVSLAFFGGLAASYVLKPYLGKRSSLLALVMPALAFIVFSWRPAIFGEPLPEKPPWEGATAREYADPHTATLAILHGIIADGIVNAGGHVMTLANIQNEVCLPIARLTEGEDYALKTYGWDGWGREFRFEPGKDAYRVASAGADGAFGTADDIALRIEPEDSSWEHSRHAFFIRKVGDRHHFFLHRSRRGLFRYANRELASGLTGSEVFDVITKDDLYGEDEIWSPIERAYEEAARGAAHEPLVLQVFART